MAVDGNLRMLIITDEIDLVIILLYIITKVVTYPGHNLNCLSTS